ncbi:MAG: cobalt ECF transporter T component CbiQ [Chloroflexaceae bacterium]|jgi:cobalt/nickel transport system permease protein|nr:cobalt ECF transporter T component CbiQ [Chloroflexaceae bacterium]
MTTSFLDRYIDRQSPVHGLDGRVKLLLTLGYILALALLPPGNWLAYAACAGLLWWAISRAQLPLRTILARSIVALPFALVAVSVVFTRPGLPLFSLPLGFATLTATDAGLILFASILLKSWLSVQAALLLTATTHFFDLLAALRALHLPPILVAILSFAYRYMFVLVEEAQRLLRARDCRSATLPGQRSGGSIAWRAAVVGRMVGTLFLRSYERSERIYVAMLSRGYNGNMHTLTPRRLTPTEQGLLVVGLALLTGITTLSFFM